MSTPRVIPALRYRDAAGAIAWLTRAFGFEEHFVVRGGAGRVAHAQLRAEGGLVMLGEPSGHAYDAVVKPPADAGGACTQAVYLVVADARAHHARAVAAGAEVVVALREEAYGGWAYSCRDPEGHVWSFGEYDPFA